MSHYEEMENTLKENEFLFLTENSPCTVMGLWQHWTFEKVYTTVSALFGFCIQMDFRSQLSELLQTLKWELKPEFWEDGTCHNLLATLQLAMQTKIQRSYWCTSEVVTLVESSKWQKPAKTRGQSCGTVGVSAALPAGGQELTRSWWRLCSGPAYWLRGDVKRNENMWADFNWRV